jgi:gliding motility-associated-like protein
VNLEESRVEVEEWDFSETQNLEFPTSNYSLVLRSDLNSRNFKSSGSMQYENIATSSLKSSFSFTATVNDATCYDSNDGSIEVTVTGGTLPFDYELIEYEGEEEVLVESSSSYNIDSRNYTYENLEGGTYLVKIIDGDGEKRARTEVVGPEQLQIDTIRNLRALTCYDSEDAWFEVEASGGTPPYRYTWEVSDNLAGPWTTLGSDSIERNIGRGFFRVSVNDEKGCGPVRQRTYFETDGQYSDAIPPQITMDEVSTTDACEASDNGTATLQASGGTGDIDYYLVDEAGNNIPASGYNEDGNFSGLAPGTYEAWAIDENGCSKQLSDAVVGTIPATAITSQPSNSTVCEGTLATFTVSAEGGNNLTYQWQSDASGTWQDLVNGGDISGANSPQLNIDNADSNDEANYQVIVSSDCGDPVTSASVGLSVNDATVINTQPVDQQVCEGVDAIFTVDAGGTNPNYQWQSNAGGSWQDLVNSGDISGVNTNTLEITTAEEANEAQYRCVIQGDCGDLTTNEVQLTVNPNTQITSVPSSQTVCEDNTATFTVDAEGTNPTYQWQSDASGSFQDLANGGDISGATTNTLSIANAENADEASYRVIVTGDCGPDQTGGPVTLTVNDATVIDTQPVDQSVCEGTNASFTVDADGTNLNYQWQSNAGGSWQDLSNNTDFSGVRTDTLNIQNAEEADEAQYRCVIQGDCGDLTTSEVQLTVNPTTQITTQPTDQTVCEGTNATFTMDADGTNLNYQWQSDASGSFQNLTNGGDISGVNTNTLSIANAENGDEANYRVNVNGDCGAVQTSSGVSLTVNDATAITTQPVDTTVCEGENAAFTISADGHNLSYQWQSNASGSWQDLTNGTDVSGADANTLILANTQLSDQGDYRCLVSGTCGNETSTAVALTIDPATRITSQPSDKQVCEGEEVRFGIQTTGSGTLNYRWQTNSSGSWQTLANGDDISGALSDTLILSNVDTTNEGYYRAIVSGTCGSDTSDLAGLDVNWFDINIGQPSPYFVDTNTTKISVHIQVSNHRWIQDLGYYLISPNGTRLRLGSPSDVCFKNTQQTDLTFTTSVSDTFDVCNDALTGTYGIAGNLTPLHGSDPANGGWKVRVEDSQNWTSQTYEGSITGASIRFTDRHDVEGDTVTVSYEAEGVNIPISEYSGLAGAEPAITEYNVPTGLSVSCYGACDAIAVVSNQGGIPPYNYEWSDVSDFSNIIATGDTTTLCAGTYYVRATDALGCVEVDSVVVSEPDEIVLDSLDVLSITDLNGCYGDSIAEVHDSAWGGTGVLQYTLVRDPNGDMDTLGVNTSGDFTGLPAGDYFLEVRDDNNCFVDTSFVIEQPDSLEIVDERFTPLSSDGATDGSIGVDAQGGTAPLSYVLHLIQPADTLAVDTTSNGEFTGLSQGTYYVEVFDVNDCGRIQSSDFRITSLRIDFEVTPVQCANDSNGRIVADITGGLPPLRYEWTSLAGDTLEITEDSLNTDTLANLAGGDYILNVIDSTGNNERDTATVNEPDPLEIVEIVPDTLSAAGASDAAITVRAAGGNDTIIFEITNLNVTSFMETDTSLSVNDTATVQFDNLEAGLYEVTVYDEKGCGYDMDTTHVIHFELTLNKQDVVCNRQSNGLAVASVSGGTVPFTYDWGIENRTGAHRLDSLKGLGGGWYHLTVTDANGFALTDSVFIVAPPRIEANAVITQANCPSSHIPVAGSDVGSVQLNVSGGVPYSDPDNSYRYYWYEEGDTIAGKDSITGIRGGDHRVSIIDSNGCSLDTTITVPQVPQNEISVQYGGLMDSICYGSSVEIYVENIQNADSLYWEDLDDQYTLPQDLDTLSMQQTSDRVYTLRARNDACILVDSLNVALYPTLGIAIDEQDEVADDKISLKENVAIQPIQAIVQNNDVEATYQWEPERFFNPTDQLQTELSVENMRQEELGRQKIRVVATTQHCTEMDTAIVELVPNVEPFNAFSPNGDGTNDLWHIRYAGQYENIEVVVFNRWGVKVYRAKPYTNAEGWDGRTSQGKELPSGTYYYVIDTHESGITPLSGTVTIIR